MATRWVCDFCGYEGSTPGDVPPDQVQCPMCGELVTPLPSRSGAAPPGRSVAKGISRVRAHRTASQAGCVVRDEGIGDAEIAQRREQRGRAAPVLLIHADGRLVTRVRRAWRCR
jgi:hypothetical protein